jgi:alcohol dehydrogenase class IV
MELRKFVAPEFVFGPDARLLAPRFIRNFSSRRVLVVTDPGVIGAGWVGELTELLKKENIDHAVYSSVTPNPKAEEVMAGAEVFKSEHCDALLAIGGGSPMDCAKGIGIVSSNKRHILEFEGVDQVNVPGPPLICLPTTAGTSADVSQFAIIADTERKVKIAIVSKTVVPDVALIDPVLTTTMDAELTACTGMDALVHGIEAYVSNASSPITDLHALQAVRLVNRNIVKAVREPGDFESRERMMLASLHAGLAFSNASLGAVHAMAHSVGGFTDAPHGELNTILLKHVMDYNFSAAPERYMDIGRAMGVVFDGAFIDSVKHNLLDKVGTIFKEIGLKSSLKDLGVRKKDIPQLARNAMSDACIVTNPKRLSQKEIEEIYEKAL